MFARLLIGSFIISVTVFGFSSPVYAHDFAGTIEKPTDKEWGELYLVEIELPKARPHPSEYYCNSYEPDTICLGASVIYRKGRLLRTLASTDGKSLKRRKISVKGIGPHAARYAPATYVVALLERTDDGYFWMPVQEGVEKGRFCIDNHTIEYFSIKMKLMSRKSKEWNSCFRL